MNPAIEDNYILNDILKMEISTDFNHLGMFLILIQINSRRNEQSFGRVF
jgi:hypothetical protein